MAARADEGFEDYREFVIQRGVAGWQGYRFAHVDDSERLFDPAPDAWQTRPTRAECKQAIDAYWKERGVDSDED